MTKGDSHRLATRTRRAQGLTQKLVAQQTAIGVRTLQRWDANVRAGLGFLAKRKRRHTYGIVTKEMEEILLLANSMYPQMYYDELADVLDMIAGSRITPKQVRAVFARRKFRYNLINEYRPLEQDAELFRFWRDHVIYLNGPIRALQLVYIDEASTRKRDAWRPRAHGAPGVRHMIRVPFTNAKNACCSVIALSCRGLTIVVPVDVDENGNISKLVDASSYFFVNDDLGGQPGQMHHFNTSISKLLSV